MSIRDSKQVLVARRLEPEIGVCVCVCVRMGVCMGG